MKEIFSKGKFLVCIGTYSRPILFGTGEILNGKGEGIYLYELDPETGCLTHVRTTPGIPNPSYLALSPNGRFLYCVNELKEYEGHPTGAASAFAVEPDGTLRHLNTRPTDGTDPCHIGVNSQNTYVTVANFMSGSVRVFPVEKDGSLGKGGRFFQHEGQSVHPTRQKGPHAHSLVLDPEERYALVPDLGIDKILVYSADFSLRGPDESIGFFASAPGSGPRHCVFHPSKFSSAPPDPGARRCYVINELSLTVDVLGFGGRGNLSLLQTVPLVGDGVDKNNSIGADIQVAPDGKHVYASIRGLDTLSVLEVGEDGLLSLGETTPCGGRTPRNFAITPDGKYLLAANQDTDNVAVFQIDPRKGGLSQISDTPVPTPVCVKTYSPGN